MSELDAAALKLAGVALVFVATALAVWWMRRPRPEPAAPKPPEAYREPREIRLPGTARKAAPEPDPVAISASRLARISGKTPFTPPAEEEAAAPVPRRPDPGERAIPAPETTRAPAPPFAPPPEIEAQLDAMAADVERAAHSAGADASAAPAGIRLAPQIPPRDAILAHSWIGGRPRLPEAMAWPQIDGVDADFLAQISCRELPARLWDGLGPRRGTLAFFSHPDRKAVAAFHLIEDGPPREPPRPVGHIWFRPYRAERIADLGDLCVRAFPELAVDIAAAEDDADSSDPAAEERDYDIGDPAFHPFDWDSMAALADVLESRLPKLAASTAIPADANDELIEALTEAADANRDATARAREIIAIIRETAGAGDFSSTDATAVMAALHAIRWTSVTTRTDKESGEDLVETHVLPLTRRHPGADLWVEDYRLILFDRAKHVWSRRPERLSAPARAWLEPVWQAMAAREMMTMGMRPAHYIHGFDEEFEVVMLELPSSGLASRHAGDNGHLVLTMRKADLAAGDFAKLTARIGTP